jgi:hypothetical protein
MEDFMYKKRIFKVITLIVFIAIFLIPVQSGSQEKDVFKISEKNFETPEAAIKHFVERLAANDLAGAFESCNINEMDRFDFKAFTKRLQAMVPVTSPAPSQSLVLLQINRISQLGFLARQTKLMIYCLLTDLNENELNGQMIDNPDDKRISSFIDSCDSQKLAGLTVVKIKLASHFMKEESARKIFIEQAQTYGADDATERIILYKLNESYYLGGMRLLKYGRYWRIDNLNYNYANMSSLRLLQNITSDVDEFDQIGE